MPYTKRGNEYRTRATRVATGYSKQLADVRTNVLPSNVFFRWLRFDKRLTLAVHGTLDPLIRYRSRYIRTIRKRHPDDRKYVAQVQMLNDAGRRRLQQLRQRRGDR